MIPPKTSTCTITGLTNGTTYFVVVYPTYLAHGGKERKGIHSARVKFVAG
jgi:hypothetical protein